MEKFVDEGLKKKLVGFDWFWQHLAMVFLSLTNLRKLIT